MRSPRDLSGKDLIKLLRFYEYQVVSQKGSHIKITTQKNGKHHLAIPNQDPIKIGTLNGILRQVSEHLGKNKDDVFNELFS
ncbi:type II toxin-antitoxin system HicA family toxin [Mucilaginibacter sp.]|uniref:type II toxin-antitoxin system HicA family toxin n=1 Tax=Mucilaginibacter sp. TaxID=1882438 RepID=UPI002850FF40|nr:type II toxin-antitoxin system HicA family toxin [Mucilaginibacter sp.]MDR3696576.1 type II toxin-antitoxin system HicA family toxin [Mucilaginibacter sp.]